MSGKCFICLETKDDNELVKLKCNHLCCWICMKTYVQANIKCKIKCPEPLCDKFISDNTIRKLLFNEDLKKYESLSIDKLKNIFRCIIKECSNTICYTDSNTQFQCPCCKLINCIKCEASHGQILCEKYQLLTENERQKLCQAEINIIRKSFCRNEASKEREKLAILSKCNYVPNNEIFRCECCTGIIQLNDGVQLKNCFHNICKDCLKDRVNNGSITCPDCEMTMDDAESRAFLSEDEIDKLDILLLTKAMLNENNAYHCKTPSCSNLVIINGHLKNWSCDICKLVNCLSCQAVHTNQSCVEYLNSCPKYEHIEKDIKSGKLMRCPKCKAIIEKTSGCDWIQCISCQTELCWINQTYRWGPKGRDDISGGCKCGVNGIKCHPNCGGCYPHISSSNNNSNYPVNTNNNNRSYVAPCNVL